MSRSLPIKFLVPQFGGHAFVQCGLFIYPLFRGKITHVLQDFHRAEKGGAQGGDVASWETSSCAPCAWRTRLDCGKRLMIKID
ncbi:MAG: hypothetical protein PHU06_13320 [Gallionella sp.]|nr:hypothetical protein [Gallionella sp.]MDD4959802.1 hypothetical protein [Gallionella sp.]